MSSNDLSSLDDIKAECNRLRPDETWGNDWTDPIVQRVATSLLESEARQKAATQLVGQAEASNLKRANGYLRKWANSGAWPLDWMDLRTLPMALDGEGHKVRLGASSAEQLAKAIAFQDTKFEEVERAHLDLTEAMRRLSKMLIDSRAASLDDLFGRP